MSGVTWWKKRDTERDALNRALTGVQIKTELELALHEMRRGFEKLELAVAKLPPDEEDPRS